jgi:hypothetical protein
LLNLIRAHWQIWTTARPGSRFLNKPALRKLLGQALGSINSMLGQHIRQVLSQLTKYFISNLALSSPSRLSNRPM